MKKTLLLLFLLLTFCARNGHASALLTPAEKTWIARHPEVSYTVINHWPQESITNGVHRGLSREVLDEVERRTGLKFRYVPPEQALLRPPMMISAVNGDLLSDRDRHYWLLTFPWANTMPMIVGPKNAVRLRTLKQLTNQRIAVVENSDYIPWLRSHYPQISLAVKPDILTALQSVSEGENAAAMASGLVMLPILQRNYTHKLAIVAQVAEMASGINMAVAPEYPELRAILNKTMENITAQDAEKMFVRWIGVVDIGTPTLAFVIWQYRYPLTIITLLLLMLLLAWRNTLLARRKAEMSEKHKSDFLAVMSHEIRTPMNAIIASLELIRSNNHPEKNEFVALAYDASQDLLALLNSVLDHEKISQNKVAISLAPVQLSPLLSALLKTHAPSAQAKGLHLHYHYRIDTGTGWIKTDAHRLRQIVNNLLSNAIKFTRQGFVSLSAEQLEGRLVIQVEDTGPGISPELQSTLFEAWKQGNELSGGSGLGLYISRSLSERMGGRLTLKSSQGTGTILSCELPLEWCPIPEMVKGTQDTLPDYQNELSVLVIEDHEANRKLIAAQLHQLRCHFDTAEDGESAITLLEQENYYDVILLDCGLPGIDGYATSRLIRSLEKNRGINATPIIAISAQQSAAHLRKCRESGMNDALIKPLGLQDLAGILRKWCPVTPDVQDGVNHECKTEPGAEIWQSLSKDIHDLEEAASRRDLQLIIYHVHRIRGLAMILQFHDLVIRTGEIEEHLREAGSNVSEGYVEGSIRELKQLAEKLASNS